MIDDKKLLLKQNIFSRATFFIEKLNCFVPFGSKLLKDNTIRDIVVDNDRNSGDEIIFGEDLVITLKNNFSKEIKNHKIKAGAIAYDIVANFQNSDGVYEKRDALCLITSMDGENWEDEYFPYMLIDGKCVWR